MTPLMSDTLFGHFCWAVRYKNGEAYLEDLLSSYRDKSPPPVLFSSAFIAGHLPRPCLPPLKREQAKQLIQDLFVSDAAGLFPDLSEKQRFFKGLSQLKQWNKQRLIPVETWHQLKNGYSEYRLPEIFFEQFTKRTTNNEQDAVKPDKKEIVASNTISRTSGTVMEEGGGLFSREKTWFQPGVELDLYVRTTAGEIDDLVRWFLETYLPETGFGKDKSVGMGTLKINRDDTFDPNIFHVSAANCRLVLSLTAFKGMEKYRSYYRLKTKFGKLGGDYAFSSPTGGNPRPFKKPVLMMEPGSVFFTTDQIDHSELIDGVHSDEKIRHCGLPVVLPLRIKEGE